MHRSEGGTWTIFFMGNLYVVVGIASTLLSNRWVATVRGLTDQGRR